MDKFLNDKTLELCRNENFDFEEQEKVFDNVIGILSNLKNIQQDDVFKKYTNRFSGAVLSSAFLSITVGVAQNLSFYINPENNINNILEDKIKKLYIQDKFVKFTNNGVRAVDRYVNLVPFGKEYFSNETENH